MMQISAVTITVGALLGCALTAFGQAPPIGRHLEKQQLMRQLSDEMPAELSPPADENELHHRFEWIQAKLDETDTHAKAWWYGWLGFNISATAAQSAVAALTTDRGLREDMIVGAGTALIGAVAMFFIPFSSRDAADEVRSLHKGIDFASDAERLYKAETIFRESAADQYSGRGWLSHLGNFLIAAASSGILLGLGRYESAAINFGAAFASGELFIFSQPTQTVDDWLEYEGQFIEKPMPPVR